MSDAPWMLRTPDAPSEGALDAYVTGEASAAERAAVEAWAAARPEHQATLDLRRQGFSGLPGASPDAMRARISQALETEPAPARWRALLRPAMLGWLALAGLVWWLLGSTPSPVVPETVYIKGGLTLEVFRARDDATESLISGDTVREGDRLRFAARGGNAAGHLLVIGAEASGTYFAYLPANGASMPAAALHANGALPGAVVLDASAGDERAILLWCDAPLTLAEARIELPAGCQQTHFELHKP